MISKPQPGEYAEFAVGYISLAMDGDVIELLINQKEESYVLFSNLSEEKAMHAYAEGKWTIKEVIGHLIDAERVFVYRAMCVSRGEQQSLPGFDQDTYVSHANSNASDIKDLATEFKTLREANLYFVKSLTEDQATIMGTANNRPTSVRALIHIMAGHERHHLKILKERYW